MPKERQMDIVNPMDENGFYYYRVNSEHRQVKNTPRKNHYKAIVNEFWEEVGKEMTERKAGVYVEGFGYFCVGIVPEREIKKDKYLKKSYINPHTDSYVYYPLFIPNEKNMKTFSMDRMFCEKIKKRISEKLRKGFKYLNYYKEIHRNYIYRYRKNMVR